MIKTNCLRLGTYNIRNVTDHYLKRLPMLKKVLDKMDCDIIGLQEVSFIKKNQLTDLNENNYIEFLAKTQLNIGEVNGIIDKEFNIDGNVILAKNKLFENEDNVDFKLLKDENNKILHLSAVRVANMVSFYINEKVKLNFVNTHLHHTIEEENIRLHQMKSLLKWIDLNTSEKDLTIIVGDFNTIPNSETYEFIINNNYTSLYKEFHKQEPEKTFHNKMDAPFKDDDPEGTFDYIL
jgi:endonuclease/exonuclease/phosphatase family metal-dependent hydrolase